MNSNEFNISNSKKHNVKIVGERDQVKIVDFSGDTNYDASLISLINVSGTETNKTKVDNHDGTLVYPVTTATPGHYTLSVMKQSGRGSSWYVGWITKIPLVIGSDRMVSFEESPVYDDNVGFYKGIRSDHSSLEKYKVMPRGDNADIIRKAYEITLGCYTDYSKALAIHDWIADNIYYDLDSFYSGRINYAKLGNASSVFHEKLAVCAGYSDLAVIMLRAVGIPAYSESCYALGLSTDGIWNHNNVNEASNHAITMAYIQKRWVIMDITWDSGNKFEGGKFQQTGKTEHRYFDPTLQSFSSTHKLCA